MALFDEFDHTTSKKEPLYESRVLSVSSVNHLAKSILEGNFGHIQVEGEISNFTAPASGHWYLTLKDAKAQLRCAMFRNSNRRVQFKPANGMQVTVKGRLSIYEPRGDYQMIVDDMEEAGAGALRRAFEKLKAKLEEEGLFDDSRKKPIDNSFRHVGIITSQSGAAVRDILSTFQRRFPSIELTLLPVSVQGTQAVDEIAQAINRANRLARSLGLEVLIVGRGGGSLEDLQPFNEEAVARAIAESDLPIVSAVGHQIDFTIADFVADLRAATPTAAAELLSPDQKEIAQYLLGIEDRLSAIVTDEIELHSQRLDWLNRRMRHPGQRLADQSTQLHSLRERLSRAGKRDVDDCVMMLRQLKRTLAASAPTRKLQFQSQLHRAMVRRLAKAMDQLQNRQSDALNQVIRSLNAVSPLNTLARGYSITYHEERQVIRSSNEAKVGDKIVTRLHEGYIESTVTDTVQASLEKE